MRESNNDRLLADVQLPEESNEKDQPGLSGYQIWQTRSMYLERAEAVRREKGTIQQNELDEAHY